MHVTAIIAAGGRGQRFGGELPKQLVSVGDRAILDRSVSIFLAHPAVDEIVVVLPVGVDVPSYLRGSAKPLRIVAGGARRQDSVMNAFRVVNPHSDVVVVHDAARPFASDELVARTIAAARESGAAVAALGARDTVKRGSRSAAESGRQGVGEARPRVRHRVVSNTRRDDEWLVAETLRREAIFLAQTPQAFRRDVLQAVLALGPGEVTDEASWAERAGHPVRIVEGEPMNIKITTPEDLVLAEAISRERDRLPGTSAKVSEPRTQGTGVSTRVGTGYDLHRLVEGRPLILGGVTIPFDRGLLGHSDADAVCHAVTDALLGAASAGDIGQHFPDSDPQWEDASSIELLRRASALVTGRGFTILNADVVVIAERPKLGPFLSSMCATVAAAIGVPAERVSIKGKTNEGIGAIGRGEAIAVHAVALLCL